jgi:Tol biopolymer transport system component
VTREEIIEKLWGKDVYLDTENAINTAIRKIRLVLGDDPAQPRFVQTVTGRGYRFIARVADQSTPATRESRDTIQSAPLTLATSVVTEIEVPRAGVDLNSPRGDAFSGPSNNLDGHLIPSTRRERYWLIAIMTTALIGLAVLGFVFMRPNPMPHASNYLQLTSDGQAKQGPLVADGLRLYFSEGSANHRALAQVSASGGETSVLSNSLDNPNLLDISPTPSELLVASSGGTTSPSVWTLPLPTGAPRRIGDVLADDAAWSPDGRNIAYVSGHDLYRANNDGTGARKLVTLPGTVFWLRWSLDTTRLRLTLRDSTTGFSSIWEVSAEGKMPHPILPRWNQTPAECCGNWTPDGKYFIFQATRAGKTEIWAIPEKRGLLERASGNPVQLTAGQMDSLSPMVSSDGKKPYLIGQQLRGELVRYDSKSNEFVPYLSGISAEFLDVSRDGKWVTYVAFPEHTLWRSKVDGSQRLQLTLAPVQATAPRWSPNGKRIAFFDAAPGKPWRIYLVSADGGTPEPVLDEQHNEMDPNWSPDGNSLLFSYFPIFETAASEDLGVYILDLKTRRCPAQRASGFHAGRSMVVTLLLGRWIPKC